MACERNLFIFRLYWRLCCQGTWITLKKLPIKGTILQLPDQKSTLLVIQEFQLGLLLHHVNSLQGQSVYHELPKTDKETKCTFSMCHHWRLTRIRNIFRFILFETHLKSAVLPNFILDCWNTVDFTPDACIHLWTKVFEFRPVFRGA